MEVLFIKYILMNRPVTGKYLMIVNMGSRRPSVDDVLRLIVTLDGEDDSFSLTGLNRLFD